MIQSRQNNLELVNNRDLSHKRKIPQGTRRVRGVEPPSPPPPRGLIVGWLDPTLSPTYTTSSFWAFRRPEHFPGPSPPVGFLHLRLGRSPPPPAPRPPGPPGRRVDVCSVFWSQMSTPRRPPGSRWGGTLGGGGNMRWSVGSGLRQVMGRGATDGEFACRPDGE